MRIQKKDIINATKWATFTELAAKMVTPVTNMILARLLTPDAFGVVATATMIFSFADMFTDSGFQRYLVQHEFTSKEDREKTTTVAFWTNMIISLVFWGLITLFSEPLAILVGNPGMGIVFTITCISLPITSFSSIQMALYRRDFDFKTLFYVRMVSVIIPLVVTVPIAFITRSFWSLIIGMICGNLANAIVLTWRSSWKPRLYYNFSILKKMLSFSLWSLVEAFTIWLTSYIGVFIVGNVLSSYYVGLYKTSMNTVNQIMNLISAATATVLFSSLSRQQDDREAFKTTFLSFQRSAGLLVIPMGVGILVYQDFVVQVLLGSQWKEAAGFVGLWALVNGFKIVLSNYCSEAYRAIGKPKISVFVQTTQLLVLIPAIYYGVSKGFDTLYVMRCLVSVELIIVNLITMNITLNISPVRMLINIIPEIVASIFMVCASWFLKGINDGFIWNVISIGICMCVYFSVILLIPTSRKQFLPIAQKVLQLIKRKSKNEN